MGAGRTLDPAQEKQVRKLIADNIPDQLTLWIRKAVAQLLALRFGLKPPVRTMGGYFRRWGFMPQKPIRNAYWQNPGKVRRWLKQRPTRNAASKYGIA